MWQHVGGRCDRRRRVAIIKFSAEESCVIRELCCTYSCNYVKRPRSSIVIILVCKHSKYVQRDSQCHLQVKRQSKSTISSSYQIKKDQSCIWKFPLSLSLFSLFSLYFLYHFLSPILLVTSTESRMCCIVYDKTREQRKNWSINTYIHKNEK